MRIGVRGVLLVVDCMLVEYYIVAVVVVVLIRIRYWMERGHQNHRIMMGQELLCFRMLGRGRELIRRVPRLLVLELLIRIDHLMGRVLIIQRKDQWLKLELTSIKIKTSILWTRKIT